MRTNKGTNADFAALAITAESEAEARRWAARIDPAHCTEIQQRYLESAVTVDELRDCLVDILREAQG